MNLARVNYSVDPAILIKNPSKCTKQKAANSFTICAFLPYDEHIPQLDDKVKITCGTTHSSTHNDSVNI